VTRSSADWSPLSARAEIVFFAQAFDDEDDAARKVADFEIVLSMRERTPLPGSLINRLPRLQMLGMSGARNASLDTSACTARGIAVCSTAAEQARRPPRRNWHRVCCLTEARAIPARRREYPRRTISGGPTGPHQPGRKTIGIIGTWTPRIVHGQLLPSAEHGRPWPGARTWTAERAKAAGTTLVSKEVLLSSSDPVSIHLVLSSRSRFGYSIIRKRPAGWREVGDGKCD
jgi:D-isomer specific 2-hydroxyacid dehydrogenase, catalytic domain